jgi:hypothetical protein
MTGKIVRISCAATIFYTTITMFFLLIRSVQAAPPTIELTNPSSVVENQPFQAFADITDPDGDYITGVEWYLNDVLKYNDSGRWGRYQEVHDFVAPDCPWWKIWTHAHLKVKAWDDNGEFSTKDHEIIIWNWGNATGVGGIVVPVDKFALLAPYIGLTSTIIVTAVVSVVYVKRVKRRKEKQ